MKQEILVNKSMASDFETEWLPVFSPRKNNIPEVRIKSLEVNWGDACGALDGKLMILGSPDSEISAIGGSVFIDKITTYGDAWIFDFSRQINYIKLKYIANGVLGGTINASIYFNQ